MTEPSFDPVKDFSAPTPVPETAADVAKSSRGWQIALLTLWTTVVRLILLTVGVSGAWMIGLLIAEVFPAQSQTPPWQEKIQRSTGGTLRKLQQLPQWWQGDQPVSIAPVSAPVTEPIELSAVESQLVESELSAMRAELDALDKRLGDLEERLGKRPSLAPPAVRLRRLEQALTGEATSAADDSSQAALPSTPESSPPANSYDLVEDRVTLPSDVLFVPEQAELTLAGEQILETILPDLARYPGAVILVGSHGDLSASANGNREQTFTQALKVQRYLEARLRGYRWVVVGYGDTRPLTADADSERNRRVEIAIVPAR